MPQSQDKRKASQKVYGPAYVRKYKAIVDGIGREKYQLLCMNCNWAKRYGVCPHKMGA